MPQKFDVESWRKWKKIFEDGEDVVISEKIHGQNARFVFDGETMHYGSRTQWKKPGDKCFWFVAVQNNPWIESWCKANPKIYLFGEGFGNTDLKYAVPNGKVGFRAFDAWDSESRSFWDYDRFVESVKEFCSIEDIQGNCYIGGIAPVLYRGPYNEEIVRQCTDGQSTMPGVNHIREGCVIKTTKEKISHFGRHCLKNVSNEYLMRT